MHDDDEAARHARAERLRAEIARKISGEDGAPGPEMAPGESPLEYVDRRARELKPKPDPDG